MANAAELYSTHEPTLSLLTEPGGGPPLRLEGDAYVSASGRRFQIDEGIVRVLGEVDPLLARELETQSLAADAYEDPQLLMPRYEHNMAELALVHLFGGHPPTGTILDAGCGIGMLGRLYPQLGLVGLDASRILLRRAGKGYRMRVEASAESLPFADGTFDVVVALNMLHHVIKPENALREFRRVLRKGGSLVAVDPRKVPPIELAKKILRGSDPNFAPTHKAFTVAEYQSLIEAGGAFEVEQYLRVGLIGLVGMAGFDALGISRMLRAPQRAVDFFRGFDDALFKLPGVPSAGLNLAIRARRV